MPVLFFIGLFVVGFGCRDLNHWLLFDLALRRDLPC